jgi:uncharacterized membrane protein YgcG
MRTYLHRICIALSATAAVCIATVNAGSAGPFTNGTIPAGRVFYPAQRVIVVYKPVPVMIRQGGGNAGASGSGSASAGSGKSGGGGGGGSSGGSSGGGSVGDVFKQALGDFAKSAIDGLLKLPSK